jgi:plasmid stability protein
MTEIRILKVPEDLKRALKVRAAAEDKGLNDLILEILIASVEKANSKGAR